MAEYTCLTCKEQLDDQDIINEHISCWKCGWKSKDKIVTDTHDKYEDEESYIDYSDFYYDPYV